MGRELEAITLTRKLIKDGKCSCGSTLFEAVFCEKYLVDLRRGVAVKAGTSSAFVMCADCGETWQ